MKKIPITKPSITQKEIDYVSDAVGNAWHTNALLYHNRFEKAFAQYLSVRYALALPSCTSAIHLSLCALGIRPQDEVIVPDITWTATAAPIIYVGATPVFADIDPYTWCLSVESFRKNITPRTKAVIPVDLYGNLPEMDTIKAIALQHNIAVIEDAAEAIGSEYRKKKAGSFGNTGVFSFHASKTMTTGEGGMLVTNQQDLYKRAVFLRDHGRKSQDKSFWITQVGYKYKMSSMQAALGLAQLERIEELIEHKRQLFTWYQEQLAHVEEIMMLNYQHSYIKNTYWMITVLVKKETGLHKELIIEQLKKHNIDARPFFSPLSSMPAYSKWSIGKNYEQHNPISYALSPYGVHLPSGADLTKKEVNYICKTLISILQKNKVVFSSQKKTKSNDAHLWKEKTL